MSSTWFGKRPHENGDTTQFNTFSIVYCGVCALEQSDDKNSVDKENRNVILVRP
jgi:hypothetical protein